MLGMILKIKAYIESIVTDKLISFISNFSLFNRREAVICKFQLLNTSQKQE